MLYVLYVNALWTYSSGIFLIRIVCEAKFGGRGEERENEELEDDLLHSCHI